jgi:hypothetical protein
MMRSKKRTKNTTRLASTVATLLTSVLATTAAAQAPGPTPTLAPAEATPPSLPPLPEAPISVQVATPVPQPVTVPVPVPLAATPAAGYEKGFFIRDEDGKFELKIKARVQSLYTGTSKVANGDRQQNGQFQIRRARLVLEGKLFGDDLLYKFQTEFGAGLVHLKDWTADVRVGNDIWLRAGQWKRPFSRQFINSSGALEVIDRSITDGAFTAGRDVGIAIRNDYEKSPEVEWVVGVFSGRNNEVPTITATVDPMTGAVTAAQSNVAKSIKPILVGRVGFNHGKLKGYSEADLEGGDLRWGVAGAIALEADADRDSKASHRAQADWIVKSDGLSITGGLYFATAGTGAFKGQGASLLGGHLQGGKMLDKHWEPVARGSFVNSVGDNKAPNVLDIDAGVNYFMAGHDAKLMLGVGARKTGDAGIGDDLRGNISAHLGF